MRSGYWMRVVCAGVLVGLGAAGSPAADKEALLNKLKDEYRSFAEKYQDPDTGLIYLATVEELKTNPKYSPENARAGTFNGQPAACGYGKGGDSGMADTSLFGGEMLYTLLDVYDACPDPDVAAWARLLFKGMKIIGTTSPVPGFVIRGPHPSDLRAYYKDSSMDQTSSYVLALWRYYHSPLASEQDKAFIRDSLDKVAKRLEKNNWRILVEDDSREAWAGGGALDDCKAHAASLLFLMIGAAADITRDKHWTDAYERFAKEKDGLRWQTFYPSHAGFDMNGHLLWGQQVIFRLNCLYRMETDPVRRKAILAHMKGAAGRFLVQQFPPQTETKLKLSSEELQTLGWERGFFDNPFEAWRHFKPEYQKLPGELRVKVREICVLFPVGVFIQEMFSFDQELEKEAMPLARDMIFKVDVSEMWSWPRWSVILAGWKYYALEAGGAGSGPAATPPASSASMKSFPFTEQELTAKVFAQVQRYLDDFQDPKTHVLYEGYFKDKDKWTSPADVKAKKPMPWGYGSHIENTCLHSGHMLGALLDAYDARPDPFLADNIKKRFEALKFTYSCAPVPGVVPRGPHPDDPTAVYDDSSMDQNTAFIISLALYAKSPLAAAEDKEFIKKALGEVGARMEKHGWSIKRADEVTECHVGFSWLGTDNATILLPSLLALYHGTGDKHWLDLYEKYSVENNSIRWESLKPGPQLKINPHPIYANQNTFRMNAFYRLEQNPERKKILFDSLEYQTKLQLERDCPGQWLLSQFKKEAKYDDAFFAKLRKECGWNTDHLKGCDEAWDKFTPALLDLDASIRPMAQLMHVRFPLGGFHMVMQSEHPELIHKYAPKIWRMFETVDLKKVPSGETRYLFAVVGLHLYGFYFREKISPAEKSN